MAGIGVPALMQRFLVQGSGTDCGQCPLPGQLHRLFQVAKRRIPRFRRHLSEGQIGGKEIQIQTIHHPGPEIRLLQSAHRLHLEGEAKDPAGPFQHFRLSQNQGAAHAVKGRIVQSLHDDLRADACRIAHRDADDRSMFLHAISLPFNLFTAFTKVSSSPKAPALVTAYRGRGPTNCPRGMPGATSSNNRMPPMPKWRPTARAVSPPVNTRPNPGRRATSREVKAPSRSTIRKAASRRTPSWRAFSRPLSMLRVITTSFPAENARLV